MDMDFATSCPLVRPGLPPIRFLFVGSRLCSTLPSDSPSRFCPCALLVLHLHQVAQGTFTPRTVGHVRHTGRFAPAAPMPPHSRAASLTAAARGALPEAGRDEGMVLPIEQRDVVIDLSKPVPVSMTNLLNLTHATPIAAVPKPREHLRIDAGKLRGGGHRHAPRVG